MFIFFYLILCYSFLMSLSPKSSCLSSSDQEKFRLSLENLLSSSGQKILAFDIDQTLESKSYKGNNYSYLASILRSRKDIFILFESGRSFKANPGKEDIYHYCIQRVFQEIPYEEREEISQHIYGASSNGYYLYRSDGEGGQTQEGLPIIDEQELEAIVDLLVTQNVIPPNCGSVTKGKNAGIGTVKFNKKKLAQFWVDQDNFQHMESLEQFFNQKLAELNSLFLNCLGELWPDRTLFQRTEKPMIYQTDCFIQSDQKIKGYELIKTDFFIPVDIFTTSKVQNPVVFHPQLVHVDSDLNVLCVDKVIALRALQNKINANLTLFFGDSNQKEGNDFWALNYADIGVFVGASPAVYLNREKTVLNMKEDTDVKCGPELTNFFLEYMNFIVSKTSLLPFSCSFVNDQVFDFSIQIISNKISPNLSCFA